MKIVALWLIVMLSGSGLLIAAEKTECEKLIEQNKYQQALNVCKQETMKPGASASVWLSLGIAHYSLKQNEQAISAWQKTVELEPSNIRAWQNIGYIRWEMGDRAGAMEFYERAVKENPNHTRAWRILGSRRCEFDMNQAPQCIRELTKAIELDPTNAMAYWQRGDIRLATGDRTRAEEDYHKSLEIRPDEVTAKQRLETLSAQNKTTPVQKKAGFVDRLNATIDALGEVEKAIKDLSGTVSTDNSPSPTPVKEIKTPTAQTPAQQQSTTVAENMSSIKKSPESSSVRTTGDSGKTGKDTQGAASSKNIRSTYIPVAYSPAGSFGVHASDLENPVQQDSDTLWAPWTGNAVKPPVDIPFADVKPSLDFNNLTPARYTAAVTTAMEAMRVIMGPMTAEEEKKFGAKWAPLFDYPCKEVIDYLNRLNPLLGQAIATRSALVEAAEGFNHAQAEATAAAALLDDDGVREAMEICRIQSQVAKSLQARMDKIASDIESLGEFPNPLALKGRARQTHKETLEDLTKARFKFTLSPAARKGSTNTEYRFRPKPAKAPKGITLSWSFGDGSTVKSGFESVRHAFKKPGKYIVKATALDTATKRTITEAKAEVEIIDSPVNPERNFEGAGSVGAPPVIFPNNAKWKYTKNGFDKNGNIEVEAVYSQKMEEMFSDTVSGDRYPIFVTVDNILKLEIVQLPEVELQRSFEVSMKDMDLMSETDKRSCAQDQSLKCVDKKMGVKGLGSSGRVIYTATTLGDPNEGFYLGTLGKKILVSYNFYCQRNDSIVYGEPEAIAARFKYMFNELQTDKDLFFLETMNHIRLNLGGEIEEPEDDEPVPDEDERRAKELEKKESIAFHEANINYFKDRLSSLNSSLSAASDPSARESLQWQIMVVESDLQQERDHIDTLKTGEWVHTRTSFDDYCLGRMIERGSEEARRWTELNRALAAIPRQLALLPPDQRDQQKAIIDRLVTPQTIASGDFETITKAAGILTNSVKGYWQGQADQAKGEAEWEYRKLKLAEDLKGKAGNSMMLLSFAGGGGVYAAYMGATGYVEGGPGKAVRQAASTISTVTLALSNAYDGYNRALVDPKTGEPVRDPQTGKPVTAGIRGAAWEAGKVAVMAILMQKVVAPALNNLKNRVTGPPPDKLPTVEMQIAEAQFMRSMADGRAKIRLFQQRSDELAKAMRANASSDTIEKLRVKAEEAAKAIKCTYSAKLQLNQMAKEGNSSLLNQYLVHDKKIMQQTFDRFKQRMADKQWAPQEFRSFSNSASKGKAGMDVDYGLVEPEKFINQNGTQVLTPEYLAWRRSLTQGGQRRTVRQFQEGAQKELEAAFGEVVGGPGRPINEAFVNFTTSGHSEAYKSLAWIGSGEGATANFSQITADLARQAGDVTSFKLGTVASHNPTMSPYKAMQEQCRTLVKDLDTKLIGTKQNPGPLSNANAGAQEHVMRLRQALEDFAMNRIGPLEADRRIRELTGGEGMGAVSREFNDLLTESVMRGAAASNKK